MAKSLFKQEHDLEKRRAEATRIREKYPDRIPVIVEKGERSDVPTIDKKNQTDITYEIFWKHWRWLSPKTLVKSCGKSLTSCHYNLVRTNLWVVWCLTFVG
ncbi:putative autophagy protein Atg8 ubiquitin [Helianthus annuus]|nr:putative autophagy protein Atg8 ubiquitin [Helianthus annuus]KAJ0747281.1 putative autophagy protein Atg8 ubiquitin [Helianthus annuus]